MQVWYKGKLFESDSTIEPEEISSSGPMGDDYPVEEEDQDEAESDFSFIELEKTRKLNPHIVVKGIAPSKVIYANIISFITDNIGDVDGVTVIREQILRIHALFDELAKDVSTEYNLNKSKDKEGKLSVREDSTMRKIASMYRFFSYYIVKYDLLITEWMDSMIRAKLFNESSDINKINNTYSNIDLSILLALDDNRLNPTAFDILHKDTVFNKTLDTFFNDAGSVVEDLAKGPGLFTTLRVMMSAFKNGLIVEYYTTVDGNRVKMSTTIDVGDTRIVSEIINSMNMIESTVNSIISVEAIRTKYIEQYKMNLTKMKLTQEEMSKQMQMLNDSIKNGTINTVDDFNKIQSNYKKNATTDKEKEELGNRTARMAKAYKYKVESVLNTRRGL